ncbi:tRNA wybutosine-synthesizing protein 3 homolog [Oppia nitens]|uniref:tRNA wybutosine-synthesizing protein 3 homolog n=1 Tax=Oppia nitens TaxID=1686743 RepID=UPI0023DBBAC3|nr:tRNA wybutosine-synthesizing protein 3 homolog [Oppia nitens]
MDKTAADKRLTKRFAEEKSRQLIGKQDLSLKGSIDEPIVPLITTLNDCRVYYTTSSCSGRITVLADSTVQNVKSSAKWLFISHDLVQSQDILAAIQSPADCPPFGSFKVEPFVLHVCADGLLAARQLLEVAIACGFRNSGLTVSKKQRFIVAVRNCPSLEVPIICDNRLIVSEDYIKHITDIANEKLRQNFAKINKFYSSVKSLCDQLNSDY